MAHGDSCGIPGNICYLVVFARLMCVLRSGWGLTFRRGSDSALIEVLVRHRYTSSVSYYRCRSPDPLPLARLIAVAVTRWKIEEDHQLTKQATALDCGQVTCWISWHHWTAFSLLGYASPLSLSCGSALRTMTSPRSD